MYRTYFIVVVAIASSTFTFSQDRDLMPLVEYGLYHAKCSTSLFPNASDIEVECARRVKETDDRHLKAAYLCLRSEALSQLNRTEESGKASKAAISLLPRSTRAMVVHARWLARRKEIDAAMQMCDLALEEDPHYVPALVLRASIRSQELGQNESALADADHAIEVDTADARAYLVRSLIKIRLGRTQHALKDIERHIHLSPGGLYGNEAVAHTQKGNIFFVAQKHEEARREFDIALHLDSEYFTAAKGLWSCYNQMKQHPAALMAAQKLREIDSGRQTPSCHQTNRFIYTPTSSGTR